MAKSNLDSGFLILYDWLPALRSLDGDELKMLLFALIVHQREGTPLPDFDDPHTAIFAQMIAPTIKRRLDGLTSATKGSKAAAAKASSKSKPKTAKLPKSLDSDTSDKDSPHNLYIAREPRVEGTVEGSPDPRKEEIRKEEISGAKISGAKISGAEVSGADNRPRVSDADISATEFARRLIEDLSKNPPENLYKA